ncbi:phenylacetic acid degradation operon negative regulatory protein PaaX [Undibacterium sp. Di27W]|uniref:phenylacetic acid degradation operon negative regulatory protein PaaX n=1 Tax=Undibacterium sp. Di27W TaxID=3413036 RepID=UPI003BEFC2CF
MQTSTAIQTWIDQQLINNPPRAKSLVMTVFGDAIAPHGGTIWLGSLISLMSHFDINDRLVRTSVFRLAEEGWLEAKRDGRRSTYQLATASYARFQHAYKRVYVPHTGKWDHYWTLVIMSGDDASTGNKASLKKELLWEGFRMINAGVFAHPQADTAALQNVLGRNGFAGLCTVCRTSDLNLPNARPLPSLIASHWQLDEVNIAYKNFIEVFSPLKKLVQGQHLPEHAAFVIRSLLIHSFRRTQLHDPNLPPALRPAGWLGDEAYRLCRDLYQACFRPAEDLLSQALDPEHSKKNGLSLQERFGGLF